MRVRSGLVLASLTAVLGCTKIPLAPAKPLAAGRVEFRFTRRIQGPLDLTVDGISIPVGQGKKGGKLLRIEGLAAGKHTIFLASPRDAFSPDQEEVVLPDDGGHYQVIFAQRFNAVLYGKPPETRIVVNRLLMLHPSRDNAVPGGKPSEAPAAESLPGVKAALLAN